MTWCNFSTSLSHSILKLHTNFTILLFHHSFPTQLWSSSSALNLKIACLFHTLVITLSQYMTQPSQTSLLNSFNLWLKRLHVTDHLFDGTGQKVDLDFGGRKFVLLVGPILVWFGWFRANEALKCLNFRPVKNLTSIK